MYKIGYQAKQKKTKSQSRIIFYFLFYFIFYFLTTEKIKMVRMEANLHYFPMASKD